MPRTKQTKLIRMSGKQWYNNRRKQGHRPKNQFEKNMEEILLREDLARDGKCRAANDDTFKD